MTGPLLDVAECLLKADAQGEDLYGWQIMKDTKRSGPTVYDVLERLEGLQWITRYWERLPSDESRPRRRLYSLTVDGRKEVRDLLAERRPKALGKLADPDHPSPAARPSGTPLPEGA